MPDVSPSDLTFEESLVRLEEIVKQLDDGRTDLETALERYEEGVGLLRTCHRLLENAQRKIEVLRGENADGTFRIKTIEEEKFKTDVAVGGD